MSMYLTAGFNLTGNSKQLDQRADYLGNNTGVEQYYSYGNIALSILTFQLFEVKQDFVN